MAVLGVIREQSGVLLITLSVFFLLLRYSTLSRRNLPLPLPPGPPGEPILGHLRVIPTENPEYTYLNWSKQYSSPVLSFVIFGQPIIILNTVKAATDLLHKKGAVYCDRPRFVLYEVMGWKKTLTFMRSGPEFKMHRQLLQKAFTPGNIKQYRLLQEMETSAMLKEILQSPEQWERHMRRFATAVILGIGFGINIEEDSDPLVQTAEDASLALSHGGAPASTPVDFFPFLRYLPRLLQDQSLNFARDMKWAIQNLHNKPYEASVASTKDNPSLMKGLHRGGRKRNWEGEDAALSIDDIKGAAGAVFAAGQDTIWSTLVVFVLNMVLHPEVQTQAQQVLDEAVGRDRLPTFDDRPRLRYIGYIVQETLRWCPVSPLGVPHRSLQDDTYQGYFIPAGSYVYANARAMTHDEEVYSDPDTFDPNRYAPLTEGGSGEPFPVGQFGFGRRICVGRHLAEASVWIVVARILSTMRIEQAQDSRGNKVAPQVDLTNGLTSHPKSFPCRFVPRDEISRHMLGGGRQ